jgi:hypothetical protein
MRNQIIAGSPSSNVFGIIPFIKNLPVIPITLSKFFIPYSLCTLPFFDNILLITGVIFIIIFIFLIYRLHTDGRRTAIWGGVWFLAFSIPPMFLRTFYAKIGYEYFDYRAYLPIIGILLVTGLILNDLLRGISFKKMLIYFIPLFLVYSIITINYMPSFNDPVSFFTSAIELNPKNAMAYGERGVAYSKEGSNEKALADYDNSIRVWPAYPTPYFNKGVLFRNSNDQCKAEYYFSQALKYDTINHEINILKANTYINLSLEKLFFHKYDEAVTILKEGIRIYPDNGRLHNNLGLEIGRAHV